MVSESTSEIEELVRVTKSNSGISGKPLRDAHRRLGNILGERIREDYGDDDFVVFALLRSGAFLATGIADELGCPIIPLDEKHDVRWSKDPEEFIKAYHECIEGKVAIIADAVINSGESIRSVLSGLQGHVSKTILVANVVQEEYSCNMPLYCTRTSSNKFKGCHIGEQKGNCGPDTGDRLMGLLRLRIGMRE